VTDPDDGPSHAGFGDMRVGLKYRLLDETPQRPALLAAAFARLPTGSEERGLGEPGTDVQALAAMSKAFGALTLTLNAGYTFVTDDRRRDVVNVNASAELDVTEAWTLVGEIVSELATSRGEEDRIVLRAGATYAITGWLELDGAVGVGVTRAGPDVLVTLGITAQFNTR
jgi:hypothetical protein